MQEIADVLESYSGYSGEELAECLSLWENMKDVKINGKKRGRTGHKDEDKEEKAGWKKQKKIATPNDDRKTNIEEELMQIKSLF